MEQDKEEEILRSGFDSGFFQTKKMTLHHLTINRANESRFFKSLSLQGNYELSKEGQNVQTTESGNQSMIQDISITMILCFGCQKN